MKVGIITFHFVSNQGGVLQAYASQTYLEKKGHEAFIINYCPNYHTVQYAVRKNPFLYARQYWKKSHNDSLVKRIRLTIRNFVKCIYMNIVHSDAGVRTEFDTFIVKNLHLTKEYRSLKQLESEPPIFNAYVTGSDQLWNPELLDFRYDEAYFLSFADKQAPRVAYAVSIGRNPTEKEKNQLKRLASNLTAVSMREFNESTVSAIGKDVHICIDPTLLLDANDYTSVESKQVEEEPYIFVYGFETTDDIKNAVKMAANKYGCRIINGSPRRIKLGAEVTTLSDYGPDRFLTLIKNARCVVTNSFHGTAFSIIYKKDFITVPHSTRGIRMTELLGKLGLNRRLWGSKEFSFEEPIPWDAVYERLNLLRNHSGDYLLSAIQGVHGENILHWNGEVSRNMTEAPYGCIKAYAGFLADEHSLKTSASGGAASALAAHVIQQGGSVAGAAYTDDFRSAVFTMATNLKELERLKGSKYIPAEKQNGESGVPIFESVLKKLVHGEQVLFIGLPCNVGGLKTWLQKQNVSDENLITVDLICHGTMPQIIQNDFIEDLEKKYGSKVKAFSTRYVKSSWSLAFVYAQFENGKIFLKPLYETDLGFALKFYARSSCYQCHFKGLNHKSDLTVGDYWGLRPDDKRYNKYGVSIIFVRTAKGEKLVKELQMSQFILFDADIHAAVKHNPMLMESVRKPDFYGKFQSDYEQKGLHYAVTNSPGYYIFKKAALKNRLLHLFRMK